mmetsp:Transcript_1298/g.2367  ORF Transcript_1298/g.2367 Transcript_1298/m.2367 type:complete len:372 (+) Transcript_1298:380-1495(+)
MSGTIHLTLKTKYIINESCSETDFIAHSLLSTMLNKQQSPWKQSCIIDELQSMCKQELTHGSYNKCPDNLWQKSPSNNCQMERKNVVDESCREKIVAWCYRVIDYFGLKRDTVYIAMTYLDRFMSIHSMERYTYKLAATTALLLAIKIHDPKKINLKHTVKEFSNGQFDNNDVVRMELIMLRSLSWKMHPPCPTDFIPRLLSLQPLALERNQGFDVENVKRMAIFFVELSVWDYSLLWTKRPSIVAISAILNAMDHLGLVCQVPYFRQKRHEDDLNDENSRSIVDFIERMLDTLDLKNHGNAISKTRCRLRRLYEKSAEYTNNVETRRRLQQKQIQVATNFASVCRLSKTKAKDHPRLRKEVVVGSPKSIV